MNINVRLIKNFTTAYNKMQEKYGEEMAKINGFSDAQLSYTDFIDNFIDEPVVADASIDGNANIVQKDIVTLINEMPKPHQKLLAFNKIHYELNKKYDFKTANEWLEKEWTGFIHMHDANTTTFVPYCYKGEETLVAKYKNKIYNISFSNLYELLDEAEKYDVTIQQDAKFPNNLYVLDIKEKKQVWAKVKRVVKHFNSKPMRFIKYANGLSQIITEDHPIITLDGEVPAKDVTTEDKVYSIKPCRLITRPQREDFLTKEFGWVVGMCLAEGSAQPSSITVRQNDGEQYDKLLYLLNKFNMPYSLDNDDRIRIKVSKLEKFIEQMLIGKTAAFKQLPADFIEYPPIFLDGVVAGLIDSDGTIGGYKNRQCQIRIASEILCHQISDYLRTNDIFCDDRTPYIYNSDSSFKQRLPLFGITFTLTNEDYFLNIDSIKINNKYGKRVRQGNFKNKKYQDTYGWVNIIENTEYIDDCPVVYDITTETGHFICNNILSHNCFAYDLKELAEKGLYFLSGNIEKGSEPFNNEAPQHLETFVDFVKEYVNFTSNRTSGACGLPNLIPYMYYFWKKDKENGYYIKNPDYHARQQFQRLIYGLNQPYTRNGIQSAFTNTSVFDKPYLVALFGGAIFPDGSLMIDSIDEILEFQKIYMECRSKVFKKNVMTYPVNSISLLRQNGKFVDEEFAKWAIRHNMEWSDSNIFQDNSVSSLSNCCRLKSDIKDLYFNSIGGTALKVGSAKVSTINLARIALEHPDSEKEYLIALKEITELNLKALDVVRRILKRNVEKKLLRNFDFGLIDFEHLYNTIGVLGIYETMKTFGYIEVDEFGNSFYTEEADEFGRKIFNVIHNVKDTFSLDKDYKINLEAVPAEAAAARLMKKDEFFFPTTVVKDLPLYGNQFIPLGIDTTFEERIRISSLFDSYCNGGSICHINIDAPFTNFEQAWDTVNYIADAGVTYFAFNTVIKACKHNHGFYGDICPICGNPAVLEYTRIVGFIRPKSSWSKPRIEEGEMRKWEKIETIMETVQK